ncbi:MAG: hypothetical protein GXO82_10625, partial [Chlorobi bacterium]|nr:hypothetical protein [Chlorobiota bacterium]
LEIPPPRVVSPSEIESYYKVEIPGFLAGAPVEGVSLPYRKWVFAVPRGMTLAYRVLAFKSESMGSLPVSPTAGKPNAEPKVTISKPYVIDGYRLIDLEVIPAGLRPNGNIRLATKVQVEVILSGVKGRFGRSGSVPSYMNMVNPEFAWREIPSPSLQKVSSWYRTGQTYVKIYVNKMGIYRVSASDLEAAGVTTNSIDPRTLQLFNRGVEQPVVVRGENDGSFDPGDALLFFGDMNHDPGGRFFDMWSDENVYWLTWGGERGKRFQETDAAPRSSRSDYVTRTFHFEEDHEYHLGDHDDTDERNSDYLPFETWVWKRMLKGDSLVTKITLPELDPSRAVQMRVNLQGSSRDPSQLKLFINGDSAATFLLDSYEKTERVVDLPASLFKPGENIVRWYAEPRVICPPEDPTCTIERSILDWFDLVISARADAQGGSCKFRDTLNTTPFSVLARGFPDSSLVIFNLDDERILTGLSLSGLGPYDVGFEAEPQKTYYAASESAIRIPVRLTVDKPSSWKSPDHGADYIVITHAAYKAQAERLADYRASHDGFRTVVVDVEDLYDEFNDGIKHPVAIRRFLESAYHNWQKPAPSFVVLLGDASWDPKYNMPTSNRVDYVPSWGRPADDNYYVAFNDTSTFVPVMNIGRIPAENPGMAEDVIDKVIAYEAQEPMPYHQRVMFLNGGKNKYEHSLFRSISEALIR